MNVNNKQMILGGEQKFIQSQAIQKENQEKHKNPKSLLVKNVKMERSHGYPTQNNNLNMRYNNINGG